MRTQPSRIARCGAVRCGAVWCGADLLFIWSPMCGAVWACSIPQCISCMRCGEVRYNHTQRTAPQRKKKTHRENLWLTANWMRQVTHICGHTTAVKMANFTHSGTAHAEFNCAGEARSMFMKPHPNLRRRSESSSDIDRQKQRFRHEIITERAC